MTVDAGVCRACGKPMLWVRSRATGNAMPLDAEPSERGNVLVDDDGLADVHRSPVAGGRLAHHVTCPAAASFKKGGMRVVADPGMPKDRVAIVSPDGDVQAVIAIDPLPKLLADDAPAPIPVDPAQQQLWPPGQQELWPS